MGNKQFVVAVIAALTSAWGAAQMEPATGMDTSGTYTIGVVVDGRGTSYGARMVAGIKREIQILVGEEREVVFKEAPVFDAGWSVPQVEPALKAALNDPEVDLVLAADVMVSRVAALGDFELTKPVVSGIPDDPDSVGMPYNQQGFSTRRNLSFAIVPLRATRDISVFHDMIGFTRLHVLADARVLEALEAEVPVVLAQMKEMGVEGIPVPMDEEAQSVLERLPEDAEAAYLTPKCRMNDAERQKLIDGINERGIPSFSLIGHEEVKLGILAGLSPDISERMARRVALNIQQIMLGTSPNELAVNMPVDEKLLINMKTAARIGFYPDFRVLLDADTLHGQILDQGDDLSMEDAVHMALANNVELAVNSAEVEGTYHDNRKSRSILYPQLEGNIRAWQIDKDRATASMGLQPRDSSSAGVSLTQIVFNDPAIAAAKASSRLLNSSRFEHEAKKLDIAQRAASAFVQFLSMKATLEITEDNLKLSSEFLDMARMRHKAGMSGPEEIYRWESEVANAKSSLLETDSLMRIALASLNQVMGAPISRMWTPKDIQMGDGSLSFVDDEIDEMVSNMIGYETFIRYGIETAMAESPELKAVNEAIRAQEIALAQYKRRFVLPEVAISGTYDHIIDETIEGAPPVDPTAPPPATADDNNWQVAIEATWPLFEGGGKPIDVSKAKSELRRLKALRKQTIELLTQQIYSTIYGAGSSHPSMALTRRAAESAKRNLAVIQDKYAHGSVSILELLDAQNNAFVTEQSERLAVYQYVEDAINVGRAMAWFEPLRTQEENEAWLAKLKKKIEKAKEENRLR